jgi:hypothetical protein
MKTRTSGVRVRINNIDIRNPRMDALFGDDKLTCSRGGSHVGLVSVLLIVQHNVQPRVTIHMLQIGRNFIFYNVRIPSFMCERIHILEVSPQ